MAIRSANAQVCHLFSNLRSDISFSLTSFQRVVGYYIDIEPVEVSTALLGNDTLRSYS
jgi:hypothetical protein